VHEARLRLTKGEEAVSFENRGHFFAAGGQFGDEHFRAHCQALLDLCPGLGFMGKSAISSRYEAG